MRGAWFYFTFLFRFNASIGGAISALMDDFDYMMDM